MPEIRLVYYTGVHLGKRPRVTLRGRDGHVVFDKPVRGFPAVDAENLLRSPDSFRPAVPLSKAAQRYGIPAKRLAELGEAGEVHVELFEARGEDPVEVLVMDETTAEGLASEKGTSSEQEEAPEPEPEEEPKEEPEDEESEES